MNGMDRSSVCGGASCYEKRVVVVGGEGRWGLQIAREAQATQKKSNRCIPVMLVGRSDWSGRVLEKVVGLKVVIGLALISYVFHSCRRFETKRVQSVTQSQS